MKAGTHLVGALAAATAYDMLAPSTWTTQTWGIETGIFIGASLLGGLLPDICHPNSTAGRRVSLLAMFIRRVFGHRTFTHSLMFLFLIGVITGFIPGHVGDLMQIGIFLGMISHFLLDMLTSRGIQLFYPFDLTVRFPFHTRTGSFLGEGSVLFVCMLWISYYSLSLFGFIG